MYVCICKNGLNVVLNVETNAIFTRENNKKHKIRVN